MTSRPWLPLLAVSLQVGVLGLACAVGDLAGPGGPGGWPFLVGFALLAVVYASWPWGITLVTGIVAASSREPANRRGAVLVGAVVATLSAALGALLGLVWVARADEAGQYLLGGALVAGPLLAAVPLVAAFRSPAASA